MNRKITSLLALFQNRGLLALSCLVFGVSASAQTTYFVKPVATGTGDGSSWENAAADLQLVINNAVSTDQIWVAGGTYLPTRKANDLAVVTENNKDNAFVLKDGVKIYGGFSGTETELANRDLNNTDNISILSGDFSNNDVVSGTGAVFTIANATENAYHVVLAVATTDTPLTPNTLLDGFIIKGGNAQDAAFTSIVVNTQSVARYNGGGIATYNYAAPTFSNILLTANSAAYGGGIYNRNYAAPVLKSVIITQNSGTTGGGITNWFHAAPQLTAVTITENASTAGGGIYNYDNAAPVLNDVMISLNTATAGGGGMYNYNSFPTLTASTLSKNSAVTSGGGMFSNSKSKPILNSVSFDGNTAADGGGMYNADSSPTLNDVYFTTNKAITGRGGAIYNIDGSSPIITKADIYQNSAFTYGGGIANWSNSSPIITESEITENTAQIGGGILNNDGSLPQLTNVSILNNAATLNGGGIANYKNSSPILTNILIAENTANIGGGIFNQEASSPILTNVTIAFNKGVDAAGGMANNTSNPEVRNSIIYGNTATESPNIDLYEGSQPKFYYSLVEGSAAGWSKFGINGGNNIDADPLFANTELSNYTMQLESPTIDAGSNTFYDVDKVPNLISIITDLAANNRFYENGIIDMGAFENQGVLTTPSFTKKSITVYPNPVADEFTIQSDNFISDFAVYNMLGQVVLQQNLNANQGKVNVSGLQNGNYVVKVISGSKVTSLMISKQ